METTLVTLFEKNEQQFRSELSAIHLPKDMSTLQKFLDDFFVDKVSVAEYKKELTMSEIAMLNSVVKLVSLPMSLIGEWTFTNALERKDKSNASHSKMNSNVQSIIDKIDGPLVGATALGGLIGGLVTKTWGGVLCTIAGCVLGMCLLTPNQTKKCNPLDDVMKIDVDKYIVILKQVCHNMDEIIDNYRTSIAELAKSYDKIPEATLASKYKPILDRLATLYVSINNEALPTDIKTEFDKLYRTLKNHHYEIVDYGDDTRQYFIETPSVHVSECTVIKAAILENGRLIENGECLIPEMQQ